MMPTFQNHPIRIDGAITHGVAKVLITHADLSDNDTSQVLDWDDLVTAAGSHHREYPVPANALILRQWHNLRQEFAGGGATAVVMDVGDGDVDDELAAGKNVFTGAGTGLVLGDGAYAWGEAIEADYNGKITFTVTDGTCLGLTAGIVEVFVEYLALNASAVLA
jgi:hypothetical protein